MGFFDDNSTQAAQHAEFQEEKHKGNISHELLAGAAAFVAARKYEEHVEKNGKPASHDKAKALLAGFAAAFIDREVETQGLDKYEEFEAKKAKDAAAKHFDEADESEYPQ